TPAGRAELQELESRYEAAGGKLRPAGASGITYLLVHEREQGLIAGGPGAETEGEEPENLVFAPTCGAVLLGFLGCRRFDGRIDQARERLNEGNPERG